MKHNLTSPKQKTTSNCIKKNKELVIDGMWYSLDI